MRVQAAIDVAAPPELVWGFVTDPTRYLHFMNGITRWEIASEQASGVGARYRTLMRVGSAEVGGLVEVVEHEVERDLAWASVTGIDLRGRWRLREIGPHPPARTHVELRLQYGVAGSGPLGWVAEQVAAPAVRENLRRSLRELKRQAEHEQARTAVAARRAAVRQ
ncbi:MAG TPA: SRPBCC family protein [Solirubrobacteraceae bacterium]|nr:SRPBCC family protein [Solirubrobacteraceae bacterium]